jgi:hypothetical protein
VLLLYHRPALLRRVFAAVAEQQPRELLLVADGPKDDADAARCAEARAVVEDVAWPCTVRRLYAESNLGLRLRVSSGLDWVFEQVEEAIILEDDCVPDPSFFRFCQTLLERYGDDERVMEIGGGNFQLGRRRTTHSYYFSAYCCVYGWATWRRAWRHYDLHIRRWPELRSSGLLESVCGDGVEVDYWRRVFDEVYDGRMASTWDYQWLLALWSQHGLSVVPEVNLVSNIGFGPDASHTKWLEAPEAALPTGRMDELDHPLAVWRNRDADRFLFDAIIGGSRLRGVAGFLSRVRAAVRWHIGRPRAEVR